MSAVRKLKNSLIVAIVAVFAATALAPSPAHATNPHERIEYLLAPFFRMVGYDVEYVQNPSLNLLRDIPAANADGSVNMVVEIPMGDNRKFETDHHTGKLFWELKGGVPRVINYLPYPFNYGMIPRTLGGDGDSLDIITLAPYDLRGSVVPTRVIGVMYMDDGGEVDDKLIAVIPGTPMGHVTSLAQLNQEFPGVSEIVRIWFTSYKGPGKIKCPDASGCWGEAAEAMQVLQAGMDAYQ